MIHHTNFRREREPERWRAQGERESLVERQRLECREQALYRCSETKIFSPAYLAGVFCCKPFLQPPSILPISSKSPDILEYFSVGMSLLSQASCIKNFKLSSLAIVLLSMRILLSLAK